jgi:hypothetical protein
MPDRNGILISAIPATASVAFAPRAMAQSGTDTADLPAGAQSQIPVAPARKAIAAIAGRVVYEDELLPLMEEYGKVQVRC